MNWLAKISLMIAEKKRVMFSGPYMIDIDFYENTWSDGELESITTPYLWLSKAYIDFIKKYDNIGIAWVTFYGSEAGNIIPLGKEIEFLTSEGLPKKYFPFGKGPGGEVYAFNKDNQVIEFASDDYDFEHPKIMANSLENFVDECLLGKRYTEFNNIEKDRFYQFLQAQGWA